MSERSGGFSKTRLGRVADVMRGHVDFHRDFWTLAYQAIGD
jgi:hypothetical protein